MNSLKDDVLSYREMCDAENVQTLQRGMNYRLCPSYSVILMSQRVNAPYKDKIYPDGITLEYEGHDVNRKAYGHNPKLEHQISELPSGKLTQNGLFIDAVNKFKDKISSPERIKVYEKIMDGVWSLKGYFDLLDYKVINDGARNIFRFILRLAETQDERGGEDVQLSHTRLIPSEIKKEVWKRDDGRCVYPGCGANVNLHFDHILPFSKGGTSLTAKNVRLLCMKHNLEKSAKIE